VSPWSMPPLSIHQDTQTASAHLLMWDLESEKALKKSQESLAQCPSLSLSTMRDVTGMALGVPTQALGPAQQRVGCLSKEPDLGACGWPACLRGKIQEALLHTVALRGLSGRGLTHVSLYIKRTITKLRSSISD
uniref:Uncharacterized protein n=1 Tax=Ursus americanus TaxID=9643 RepID=A0A452QA92_URSAM